MTIDNCDRCGGEYENDRRWGKPHWFCPDCRTATVTKKCLTCGEDMTVYPAQKYCSRRCADISRRKPKPEPKVGDFKCRRCDYFGGKRGIIQHSRLSKHKAFDKVKETT